MKKYAFLVVVSTIVLSALLAVIYQSSSAANDDADEIPLKTLSGTTPNLILKDRIISLDVASTSSQLIRGLSGRKALAQDQAMLFVFSRSDYWAIWMKDMNFPIDIIWLDADMRVVTIKANVTPDTYPQAFQPEAPALYVLETPPGAVDAWQIAPNQKLDITF